MWVALTILLATAAAGSFWFAARTRESAVVDATATARTIAQTDLGPLVAPRELAEPIIGERARELRDDISRTITSQGRFDDVRIYTGEGRALFAQDPTEVGVRAGSAQPFVAAAASGPTRGRVIDGTFEVFVPLWTSADGTIVAELSGPAGALSSAGHTWSLAGIVAAALAIVSLAMVAVAKRTAPSTPEQRGSLYQPAIPRRAHGEATHQPTGDVFATDQRAHLKDRLVAAEGRATAAEESFRTVQEQLKQTLARIGELEGRLAMEDETRATTDREMAALRTQVTETAERLHTAEIDNNALRERMALRQQELDEARRQLQLLRATDTEIEDLALRLETAQQAAAALERELARVEAELDHTKSDFHMTKLTEALRELDEEEEEEGVAVSIDDEDDLYEHPVIIRDGTRLSSGKVR